MLVGRGTCQQLRRVGGGVQLTVHYRGAVMVGFQYTAQAGQHSNCTLPQAVPTVVVQRFYGVRGGVAPLCCR